MKRGISTLRRNCLAAVEVVVAERLDVEAHQVHGSTAGLSSKKFEIGGVAPPNESPPVTEIDPPVRLGPVGVEPGLQEGRAADREGRVRPPRSR